MGLRFLALACLVGAAFAGPVQRQSESQCAKKCDIPSHPKFRWESGKAYVYELKSRNIITYAGKEKRVVTITVPKAEIHFPEVPSCDVSLVLKDVRIEQESSREEKELLKRQLEEQIVFGYNDGVVLNVCPSSEESSQSLKIKKAIISLLVNEMTSLEKSEIRKENDLFGACSTKYTVENKEELVITKEKDLKSCKHNEIYLYLFQVKLPRLELLEKNQIKCTQHIKDGIMKVSECRENHELKTPLKDSNGLFKLSATMGITLTGTKPAQKQSWQKPVNREEISHSIEEPREADRRHHLQKAEHVLKELCSKNRLVDLTIGKDYIALVSHVKYLSYDQLEKLDKDLRDGTLCDKKKVREIYHDALAPAATDAGIKLIVKLMINQEAKGVKYHLWPATFALKQNPTEETVSAVVPLVKYDSDSTSVLLGITTLIRRVCSSEDCSKMTPVKEIIKIYNDKMGRSCSSEKTKEILTALRAFRNMGQMGDALSDVIACAKDQSKPVRVRMNAIQLSSQTKRGMQEIVQIYSNEEEDGEVRIYCLKSILEHPDKKHFMQVKRIAEKETDEQVSSYMYSYIQNLNKTQSPRHQEIKTQLQDIKIDPPKHHSKIDYLTSSKNILLSAYNKALNVGGYLDADVIHGKTKMPLAMHSSLVGTMYGKEVKAMEWGLNSEGLEDVMQAVLDVKDKIPKFETIRDRLAQQPTFEEFKEEYSYLSPSKIFGDTRAALSVYFRILGMEIGEISTSDLPDMKEMLKLAELMSKLAHGEKADFSHSVVLANTKLSIPSLTGITYSIDLVGSSTVGITAATKADILNLPRHADVHLKIQPSASIEFSTSVRVSSTRPIVKVVSRWNAGADVEARFRVKDGHAVLASLTLPSEDIATFNMSTSVFEIDEENKEKPIFEKMQKKIDYSFKHLHKPLGVTAHATVEVPEPFVTKSFPYVWPFGNVAIALKKSDASFKSYEFRAEMPKQTGPSMKYRASLDTPGSKVARRFAADLEVKQERDQKDLLLEIVSPFKTVGGNCSITKNDKHIKVSTLLHSSGIKMASANFTGEITGSKSRKICKVEGSYDIRGKTPARIEGTVAITKGRKEHISFDFKTVKSQTKPIALKGTIMKEGRIEFSPKSEWKLSSEISLSGPHGDLKLRKTVEKRSKQSKSISVNVGLDYQLKGKKKHSMTISGASHKSSNKVNTQLKLESSQYPRGNLHLTWDMQKESHENITNDIKLTNGKNPHQTYFHLKHKSSMPKVGQGHCYAAIELPLHDLYYNLSLTHDIDISEKPRMYIEADLCYKQGKHIKGIVDVKTESVSPLKAKGKFELEFPGGHYIYEDELKETNDVVEGKSTLQYQKDKVVHIHYKYNKKSTDSKLHHEIEGSIQTPSSRSPINGKASIELSSESLAFVGEVGPQYSIQAHVKENGVSHFKVKLPMIEGFVKTTNEDEKKKVDIDLKLKTRRSRHIVVTGIVESGDKKTYALSADLDAGRTPNRRVSFNTTVKETSNDRFVAATKIEIFDLIKIYSAENGDVSFLGDFEWTLEVSTKKTGLLAATFKREASTEKGKLKLELAQNHEKKAVVELNTKLNENGLSIDASLTSPVHSFEDMHAHMNTRITKSRSSKNIKINLSFKKNNQLYKTEWNSDIQPNGLEVKAEMQTPHKNYEKSAVGFSIQLSEDAVSSSVSIDCSDNKKIYIQTEIKTSNHAIHLVSKVKTPFANAEELQIRASAGHHHRNKHLEISVDVEDKTICELKASLKKSHSETLIKGNVKLSISKVKIQSADLQLQRSPDHASISANIQLVNDKVFSFDSEIKENGSLIYAVANLATPYEKVKTLKTYISIDNQESKRDLLIYVDRNEQRRGDLEINIIKLAQGTEVKGRVKTAHTPEMSVHIKSEKSEKSFSISANVMKGTSRLFSTSLDKLSYHGGEKLSMKTKRFEDNILDLEISKDVTGPNSIKFSVKVDGPCSPVSISFLKNQNDRNSVSTELRMCSDRVQNSRVCYLVKSYHKNLVQSENYRFYQKVTMDMEKSVGGHFSKPMGRVHVLISATDNDYRLKTLLEVGDKKFGHDSKLHLRQHDNDRCSIDSHIYLFQLTSRARVSIVHNVHQLNLDIEGIPNIDDPTRKLSLLLKKEMNPENKELSGYIKMSHPRMPQPILITCKLEHVREHFYKGRIVLHSGPAFRKTWVIEMLPNLDQEDYGIRSLDLKVYNDDKSMDTYVKLIRQSSRREEKMGLEWKSKRNGYEKEGKTMLILSDKKEGIPQTLKFKFISPSADYELHGSVATGPRDVSVSVTSRGRKLHEVRISIADDCATIEVTKSENALIKSLICLNKREGPAYHLLKVDMQYLQHKCLEIRVGVNPEKPEYIDVVFKCNKEKSCRPLKELVHYLESLVKHHSLRELRQDIIKKVTQHRQDVIRKVRQQKRDVLQKVEQLKRDIVEPLQRELRKSIEDLKSKLHQHEKLINEYIRKVKEIKKSVLECVLSAIPSSVKEIYQKVYQDYHAVVIRYYKKVLRYWPSICESRWYCNDIKSAFRHFDTKEIKTRIDSRMSKIKQSLSFHLPGFRMFWPSDLIRFVKNGLQEIQKRIKDTFGSFIGQTIWTEVQKYGLKLESIMRQKFIQAIDEVIKKMNNIFTQDADLRTARDLILNVKDEIVNAWKNKEKIAESSAKRMEDNIKQNLKKFIQVSKYDPDEGEVRLSIRQPLSQDELDSVKHELYNIFSKLRQYLRLRKHH